MKLKTWDVTIRVIIHEDITPQTLQEFIQGELDEAIQKRKGTLLIFKSLEVYLPNEPVT